MVQMLECGHAKQEDDGDFPRELSLTRVVVISMVQPYPKTAAVRDETSFLRMTLCGDCKTSLRLALTTAIEGWKADLTESP